MSDSEILEFAKVEGLSLTSDAITSLRNELKNRNIGADIIGSLEREIIFQHAFEREEI